MWSVRPTAENDRFIRQGPQASTANSANPNIPTIGLQERRRSHVVGQSDISGSHLARRRWPHRASRGVGQTVVLTKNGLVRSSVRFLSAPPDGQNNPSFIGGAGLGRRWRSNVWTYPGASSLGSDARRGLREHPTVKPVVMLEDALLDLTHRGDIVLDPFLGSGSTLIASEKTGRICRGLELDPQYVDVIIRRYEAATGKAAILDETGEEFSVLASRRAAEAASQII
jgi:hypothetical protein